MKQKGNKGFTLIEILVSLAILSVVGTAVVGFMNVSAKTYTGVNNEVSVQYEAQLTVNQMKDLIIDANKGISYCLQSVDGTYKAIDPENPNSETEILNDFYAANINNVDKVKRCLLIYNEKAISDTAYQYPVMKIVWNPATEEITYTDKTFASVTDLTADEYLQSVPESNYKLLAEYVTEFSVGLLNIKRNQVDFAASFRDGNKTFKTTPTIALRNKVVVSDDLRQIYNPLPIPVPDLALRVRIKKNGIYITKDTLMAGTAAEYEAVVEMQPGATPDNSVTWFLEGSVVDEGKTASTVDQTGKVTVSMDENSSILTLKAVSPKLPNKPAIVTIEVQIIDFSKGYVRSVSLGEKLTTGITGTAATGIYSESYRFDFEDRAPFIVYINEEKVQANERGITWSLETQAPRGSYTWNASNGEITAYAGANEYNFFVTAKAKIPKTDGTTYAQDTKNIYVSGIKEKPKDPEVEIDPNKETLNRNDTTVITSTISEINNAKYKWEIVEKSPNYQSQANHWGRELITLTNQNQKEVGINVDSRLDWTQEYWIKLKLTVTGTTTDINGIEKKVTETSEKVLYIRKVALNFQYIRPGDNVITKNDTKRKLITQAENVTNFDETVRRIECTLYKAGSNSGIQSNSFNGETFECNKVAGGWQISLNDNGSRALSLKGNPWEEKIIYERVKIKLIFDGSKWAGENLIGEIELYLEYR